MDVITFSVPTLQTVNFNIPVVEALSFEIPLVTPLSVEVLPHDVITFEIKNGGGSSYPAYSGTYNVTPTQSTQTLRTGGFVLAENIVVNPIPSNYGHIGWNGSYLTVY